MPRRKRDEKGRLLKKDGSVDRRGETSKQNLKKSGLYQRVIKNKKTYESSDESSDGEDEYDIVEIQKRGSGAVKQEPKEEPVKEVPAVKEEPKEEPVKEVAVKEEPVIPEKPPVLKRTKRYKVVKYDSDSDESSDEEESEVIKKRRYIRKIKKFDEEKKRYNEELQKVKTEKNNLRKKVLYNDHLNRISNISRDITLKF
jgi:hypothetical protein